MRIGIAVPNSYTLRILNDIECPIIQLNAAKVPQEAAYRRDYCLPIQ